MSVHWTTDLVRTRFIHAAACVWGGSTFHVSLAVSPVLVSGFRFPCFLDPALCVGTALMNEDCLFLDIYRPANLTVGERVPVMVRMTVQ